MIFIAGGTGFVGRHLIKRLLKEGETLRCLVRKGSKVEGLQGLGLELTYGDITDYNSLENGLKEIEKVIHLVGIIQESGKSTFKAIHVEGTKNLLQAAVKNGVRLFFYQSALGADEASKAEYQRTKAEAERLLKESGLPYIIFRPSLIFGLGDQFTLRLSSIIKRSPFIPVIGPGEAKFQPIYVEDLISCILNVLNDPDKINKTFELGGPEHLSFTEIIDTLIEVLGVKRYKIYLPTHFMSPIARVMEKTLPKPPVTTEQISLLQHNNICDLRGVEKNFGFKPITLKNALKRFLNS